MKKFRISCILMFCIFAMQAYSAELLTTYTQPPAGSRSIDANTKLALGFTSGDVWHIDALTVRLRNSTFAIGTTTFDLYDSSGANGTPGGLLLHFGSLNWSTSDQSTFTTYRFPVSQTIPAANYWIVGSANSSMTNFIDWETEAGGLTTFSSFSNNAWRPPMFTPTLGVSLEGRIVSVPESNTMLLATVCLIAFLGIRVAKCLHLVK